MEFSDYYCIDMHGFSDMAPPQPEFGSELMAIAFPTETPAAGCDDERRLRRRMSNRESARRSRARKQRRLDELRDSEAVLESRRRDLAARAQAARGRLALVRLANAGLRAEAAALSRRLAAARGALALGGLYQAAASGGACSLGFVDIEQTIASLIA